MKSGKTADPLLAKHYGGLELSDTPFSVEVISEHVTPVSRWLMP